MTLLTRSAAHSVIAKETELLPDGYAIGKRRNTELLYICCLDGTPPSRHENLTSAHTQMHLSRLKTCTQPKNVSTARR